MNLLQTHSGGHTMVLLPCTDSKPNVEGAAIEVYYATGAIAAVKSALQEDDYDEDVDTFFLSAEHGIIPLDEHILRYDAKLEEDDVQSIAMEIGEFLDARDYKFMFSFVDGLYRKAVGEVAYQKFTTFDIDTFMLRPCGRSAMVDGGRIVKHVVRESHDIQSAMEANW